ncbi:MAG: flagellar motor switch protein FliN [SAR324 cluster bacterium]|nr:flagellar motor switch protein FliN [SAR324 cluster bacterium]
MAVDPFEAAMAQLQQDPGERPTDAPKTKPAQTKEEIAASAAPQAKPIDPFEAAQAAIDPFEAAQASIDPFDAALSSIDTGADAADPIANALAIADSQPAPVAGAKKDDGEFHVDINFLMDINLTLTFEVGRAKMYISDLLSLGQGSVIELHRLVGEDLEILVNGNLLATGEVVVVNEKFGAKLTKILSPEERVTRLGPSPI